MAGMPLDAWALLLLAVGLGLGLELAFRWARRGDASSAGTRPPGRPPRDDGPPGGAAG